MNIPKNLNYTKTHEWVKVTNNIARIGITDFAQHELTDIVFVELPQNGATLDKGKNVVVLESVKTAADVYSPLTGKVTKLNDKVIEAPEILNSDPYEEGWLFELEMANPDEVNELLTTDEYIELIGE